MKKMLSSVAFISIICCSLFVSGQNLFEGTINLTTINKETKDKANVKWLMKNGDNKLLVTGTADGNNYSSAIYLLKNDPNMQLVSKMGDQTSIYKVPLEQISGHIPFTSGKLKESKETKKIAGFNCHSAVFELAEGSATFWMTDEVKINWEQLPLLLRTQGVFKLLAENNLSGFPVEVVVTGQDGEIAYSQKVESVNPGPISEAEFKIPADAQSGEELLKKSFKEVK